MRTMWTAVMTVALTAVGVRADEMEIPLDKVPKAILDTVKAKFPKAELVEAAKETEGDKIEYEVSIKDGGVKIDVMLTPEGKITLIEKQIAAKELPKAVTDTIETTYPKSTLTTIEAVIKVADDKEALDFYEVLVTTADKKKFEVKITAAGKITETEDKNGKDKD